MRHARWLPMALAAALGAAVAQAAEPDPRAAAAEQAATSAPACTQPHMGDFYWEIGDATHVIASGSTGRGRVDAETRFAIASASKWIFGAYVLQKKGIAAVKSDPSLMAGLRFTSPPATPISATCAAWAGAR